MFRILATFIEGNEQICALNMDDRRATTGEVANQLQFGNGSVYKIAHNMLHFHRVSAKWVLEQLAEQYRCNHLNICNHLSS
jgi:hypothetical protein